MSSNSNRVGISLWISDLFKLIYASRFVQKIFLMVCYYKSVVLSLLKFLLLFLNLGGYVSFLFPMQIVLPEDLIKGATALFFLEGKP